MMTNAGVLAWFVWKAQLGRSRLICSWWRLRGAQVADSVRVLGRVWIDGDPRNLSVGDGTALNEGVVLGIRAPITLGRDVHVSFHAQIQTGYLESAIIPRVHGASPIAIEDHAWIASGAVVTAGVTVGRGAIVAANSVVVQDVPPMTLVAGAPARVVRPITVDEDPALAAHDRS